MKKHQIPTPAALVDLDILEKNIHAMADTARQAGIQLRPHIKTHKIPAIAQMQMDAGAIGITCAKISEAEIMLQAGIQDILIAFPVVGEFQINRFIELVSQHDCSVTIGFDSIYGAEKINQAAENAGIVADLSMIINTGLNRDGVTPGEAALVLADQLSGFKHIRIKGILTHEGHVYRTKNYTELQKAAIEAGEKMVETAELLRRHGYPIEQVSMGSTPVCRAGIAVPGITEWRPGTYVFNDVNESLLVTPIEECALSILTTVVSHPTADRFIIDAGSKTLTADRSMTEGYGYIKEAPAAVIERLSEEHGVVTVTCNETLKIGQLVQVIPNHVCPVINLMDAVYVVRGEEIVNQWNVEARGKIV